MNSIEINNLSVKYNEFYALKDLNITVDSGIIGLLGPNGAGKTTLIKSLLGHISLHKGEAKVVGYSITKEPIEVRRNIGYVPEGDAYLPGVSAAKFVAFAAELNGLSQKTALRRAHEVLEYTGLEDARYRKIETLSYGQKLRVKLAQALCHPVKLVFLDEPTEGLDPVGKKDFLNLIKKISSSTSINIILSTHILEDVEEICQKVIMLYDGQILSYKKISELTKNTQNSYLVKVEKNVENVLEYCKENKIKIKKQDFNTLCFFNIDNPIKIFKCIKKTNSFINFITPFKPSLENIFIELIKDKKEHAR